MKVICQLLVALVVAGYYAEANPRLRFSAWVSDGVCVRPAEGPCAEVGTCCGDRIGKMTFTRDCLIRGRHCNIQPLTIDRWCNVRCSDKFTPWVRATQCIRPSGDCAEEQTCCGQKIGTMQFVRECTVEGLCSEDELIRWRECNVRCSAGWTAWESQGCSATCGSSGAMETFSRRCIGDEACDGPAMKMEACDIPACEEDDYGLSNIGGLFGDMEDWE